MTKRQNRLVTGAILGLSLVYMLFSGPSDSYLKSRAMLLKSDKGSCSGEQIRTYLGTEYVLTAAHCRALADSEGYINVTAEGRAPIKRKILAEDDKSDLLLLEGVPNLTGLPIAGSQRQGERVRAFAHGHGFATFKTEGVYIQDDHVRALLFMVYSQEDEARCRKPKYEMLVDPWLGIIKLCVLSVEESVITAFASPGSSGGMVVNDSGELTGVISAGGEGYQYMVRLQDIQNFTDGY